MSVILSLLFPCDPIAEVDVRHGSVAHHLKQIARRREPASTLGSIGRVNVCRLVATSGRYIGTGLQSEIIEVEETPCV